MSLSDRLQVVLSQPLLVLKCQDVAHLFQEVNNKDGVYVLRSVVESIFGMQEEGALSNVQQQQQFIGGGWGLRVITLTEHQAEYQAVRTFLSPAGPLLSFIYRLLNEPFQLLPFPVAWLPAKLRNEIQEGTARPFYFNKIQHTGPGKSPSILLLNSFEFYMFHFANFLVGNGSLRWNMYWSSIKDSLYPTLLEDYLAAFLPCDASLPPGPPNIPTSPRGILSPVSQKNTNVDHIYFSSQCHILPSSILTSVRSVNHHQNIDGSSGGVGVMGNTPGPYQTSSPLLSAPYSEISTWTSQTLIQILIELWINMCCPSFLLVSPNTSPIHGLKFGSHSSVENVFVPNCDHVRAVRMLIKHFHYFSNSIKPHQSSPLDFIRRNVWPIYRKSVYCFIKHLFVHWPLDSSFRLVLETWLSHIQPWRYVIFTVSDRVFESKEADYSRSVSTKWKPFLAENYLFYSSLFNFVLKRILKLDLSSPKNAQILFRVAKVFSQENLMMMLKDIENSLDINSPHKSSYVFIGGFSSSTLSFSGGDITEVQHSPQALAQVVRAHILEVERSNYHHLPLFGDDILKDVICLVEFSWRTRDILKAELSSSEESLNLAKAKSSSWLKSFFLTLYDTYKTREMDCSMEELKRCISHLETSVSQFCQLFEISISDIEAERYSVRNTSSLNENLVTNFENSQIPEQIWTADGLTLTDTGRAQLLSGLRRLDLNYEGNPDLKPICSFELGFLVKILYNFAQCLNSQYERKLTHLYYQRNIWGKVARVILSPPLTVHESLKALDPQNPYRRVVRKLPPRLTFRLLARKKLILLIVLLYSFLWICGYSPMKITVYVIVPICLSVVLLQAFFFPESLPVE